MTMFSTARSRACLALALATMLALGTSVAGAAEPEKPKMKLFKVITQRDETVIGLKDEELRAFGPSSDLENLALRLGTAGNLVVWQYAPKKASDGQLQQAPAQRIAVFSSGISRIEPYATPLPIVAPAE
ncbi:MAG TPA: hypothetical protein VHM01_19185 [Alphaproteobacteria bacterium]|nr:hypothetical protein [Alphaproteobacteria bacterium]